MGTAGAMGAMGKARTAGTAGRARTTGMVGTTGAMGATDRAGAMGAMGKARTTGTRGRVLFTNAIFHTMENEGDIHHSMLVEDGLIVGFDKKRVRGCRRVNLKGAHVFPALIDAHLHMSDTIGLAGISTQVCRVVAGRIEPHNLAGVEAVVRTAAGTDGARNVRTAAEMNSARDLCAAAETDDVADSTGFTSTKKQPLLVFSNYITAGIAEDRLPFAAELDEWVGAGREAWVLNIDGHSSACSTALLEKLGLREAAPNGILTGENHDANLGRITDYIASSLDMGLLGQGIADFCDECASFGIGCVCALDGGDDSSRDTMTFLLAHLARRFPIDVRWFPQYMDERKLARAQRLLSAPRVGGCMKWELDGSIGSRSAAFDKPFKDGSQGHLYFDTEELRATITALDAQGCQVTAHAIGELAIEQLTSIYEGLAKSDAGSTDCADCMGAPSSAPAQSALCSASTPRGASALNGAFVPNTFVPSEAEMERIRATRRHRIDHCEFPGLAILERLYALKPFVTVQPGYAWFDKRYMHGYEQWLYPEQISQQVPLATLAQHGVLLCGSSDSPVQSVDPFLQMRGMREFYVEDQSLDAYQALKTYTVNAGLMLGEKRGLLREGYRADFFTTDVDLLAIPPSGLDGLRATSLYLWGKRYRGLPGGKRAFAALLRRSCKDL